MPVPFFVVTPEITARVARFHTDFNVARMTALEQLPGNPYQVEVRAFDVGAEGPVWACKSRSPLLRGKNRLLGFTASCLPSLNDLLRFFREDDLRCTFAFYGPMTPDAFDALTNAGLWSGGGGTVPVATVTAAIPAGASEIAALPPGVVVRETTPNEKDLHLDTFRQAFGARTEAQGDYLAFQWAEDTLWDARRYVAFVDGVPAAIASFLVRDGIGFCGTAGTIPAFRGRGLHTALLAQRIADAPGLGCDLVLGGGALFSAPHRNFERAGLRLIPLGMGWSDRAPAMPASPAPLASGETI